MADAPPSKSDIQHIFKRLISTAANKQCFDCGSANPTWASVTYGVFLCIDCSAVHRSLGVHLTFIRSTQLDTNWTWVQLRAMQVGGNANAAAFFRHQGCTTKDAQQKYNSRAAHLYKEKLHQLALSTQRLYGPKLYIDGSEVIPKPSTGEDVDFFKEHEKWEGAAGDVWQSSGSESTAANGSQRSAADAPAAVAEEEAEDPGSVLSTDQSGPNVEAALSGIHSSSSSEPRKSTIGAKKQTTAKKGGLGATRVKANFSDIEVQAQKRDKAKEDTEKAVSIAQASNAEDAQKKMASLKLAYQDLSMEQKKQEERMRHLDPKKAEQAERLGMGFAASSSSSSSSRCISHSAVSDMKTIEQETPTAGRVSAADRLSASIASRSRWEDDAEIVDSPPRYGSKSSDDLGKTAWDSFDTRKSVSTSKSSWDTERFDSTTSFFEESMGSAKDKDRTSRSRRPDSGQAAPTKDSATTSDVYTKYSGAKSISSSQLFGDSQGQSGSGSFTRFEGSSSISSDDYFGGDSRAKRPSSYTSHTPDLQDIRDGVRQGVTKVATKLSTLASGVMSSIQRK